MKAQDGKMRLTDVANAEQLPEKQELLLKREPASLL
jgi:hypothetical protein